MKRAKRFGRRSLGRSDVLAACTALLSCMCVGAFTFALWQAPATSHRVNVDEQVGEETVSDERVDDASEADSGSVVSEETNGAPTSKNEAAAVSGAQEASPRTLEEGSYVPGMVLVSVKGIDEARQIAKQVQDLECVAGALPDADDADAGFMRVTLAQGADVAHAASEIEQSGIDAQPNYVYRLMDEDLDGALSSDSPAIAAQSELVQAQDVNDPYSKESATTYNWMLNSVGAYDAWDTTKVSGAVTVAVVDSGCNVNHADLKANIVDYYNAVDKSKDVKDETDHGTHVAGIIAAVANNGRGVAGVSYNAKLLPVKVMEKDKDGEYIASSTSISAAYSYIEKNASKYNVRVVNLSLGAPIKNVSGLDADDRLVINSINEAYSDYKILTVCAAGNADSNDEEVPYNCFPCDYVENALGVINLKRSGVSVKRSSSSNYNMGSAKTKDLSAPGDSIYSTTANGKYGYMSGTSMAAPCVVGVAALVCASNENLGPDQVSSIICSTATDLGSSGFDAETGYGEVNAKRAVENAATYLTGEDSVLAGSSAALKPSSGSAADWDWKSSDTSVATVNSSGVVTGVTGGSVTIAATRDDLRAVKTITVYRASITGSDWVKVGYSARIAVTSSPSALWNWSSSNSSVASVSSSGVVMGRKAGKTTITATLASNAKIKVTKTLVVPSVSISGGFSVGLGSTLALHAKSNLSGSWKWTSSNSAVASVSSNGVVKGKKMGTATITATYSDDLLIRARKTVTVTQAIPNGVYTLSPTGSTKRAVGISGASMSSGAYAKLQNANSGCAQQWYVQYNRTSGLYTFKSLDSAKMLAVKGASRKSGARVIQFSSNGAKSQQWRIVPSGKGYVITSALKSSLALSVSGTKSGSSVTVRTKTGKANQIFTFTRVTKYSRTLANGVYVINPSYVKSKALSVAGASKKDGARIRIWSSNGQSSQKWRVKYDTKTGLYTLTSLCSAKRLSVANNSAKKRAKVVQSSSKAISSQRWIITKNSNGTYTLTSARAKSLALTVSGASRKNGANMLLWTKGGVSSNQKFIFRKLS